MCGFAIDNLQPLGETRHMKPTDIITAKQATDLLGVSRTALANFILAGTVRVAIKLNNGQELFDRKEIERIAAERAA